MTEAIPSLIWQYEPNSFYEDKIIVELPPTAKPEDLPKNTIIKNELIDY